MATTGDELARRIAANVERLRQEAGLTTSELIEETRMSRSTFYSRLRNETSWTVDSLAELAEIFAVDPAELLAEGASEVLGSDSSLGILINAPVLVRRLGLIRSIAQLSAEPSSLIEELRDAGSPVSDALISSLFAGAGRMRVDQATLEAIAEHHSTSLAFLVAPESDAKADLLEAQLELQLRLKQTGAQIAMRSLDDVPASALRAIARSLDPIDPSGAAARP